MELFARGSIADARARTSEGVRMRFVGRREGVAPTSSSPADGGGRGATADNTRMTLFIAFNYGGRAEILDAAAALRRRRRGRSSPRAARTRRDMHDPGPPHPHQRRAAHLELPALAVRVLGALLHATSCGPTSAGGPGGGARRVRGAPAPLRRPLMAARGRARRPRRATARRAPRRRAPAPRRLGRRRARVLAAIPAIAVAPFIVADGGWVFTLGR